MNNSCRNQMILNNTTLLPKSCYLCGLGSCTEGVTGPAIVTMPKISRGRVQEVHDKTWRDSNGTYEPFEGWDAINLADHQWRIIDQFKPVVIEGDIVVGAVDVNDEVATATEPETSPIERIIEAFNAVAIKAEQHAALMQLLKAYYKEDLEEAARDIKYEAFRPELAKQTAKYEMRKDAQTGIIRSVTFGIDDRDRVALQFSVDMSPGSAFGWGVYGDEIAQVIKDAGVSDIKYLNGRPCYYKTDGASCKFLGMWETN